jgi:solute:Na+ symporter, SSS family
MITGYDYISIVFYFLFVVTVGVTFSRRNKNTSDYFRGGGIMPWWLAGVSAWMASFSAWTFTGAAGKIFEAGPYVLILYYSSIPGLMLLLAYSCYRFRRMRVVTPMEAIRARYGVATQQFVTWLRLPFLLLFGGVALNTVGVFMSGAFDVQLPVVIVVLGGMVTFVSLVGGAFGVAASDFVQMLLVVTVTLVISLFGLMQPSIGGLSGLLEKVPAAHFHWSEFARPEFIVLWFLALGLNNFFVQNSMENSAKYLMARSDAHARKMLIFPIAGTLVGPLLWMLPPMIAAAIYTGQGGLQSVFPNLRFPQEGAFLATAHLVLPKGMLGMLIAGIFGATLSSLDASMNQAVGILVRNFYLPIVNPNCPEKKLLILSKLCTAGFGAVIIVIGLGVNHFRTLNLFDLLNQLGISLWLPLAIPLSIGLFYKRTPAWSSWTTVLIGLATSFVAKFFTKPEMIAWIPGLNGPFKPEEMTQYYLFATAVGVALVCVTWFFFTSLFYEAAPASYKASVEEFFGHLDTPVTDLNAEQVQENHRIVGAIGTLCVIFGAFVLLMIAVPNPLQQRLGFVFCGGIITLVGVTLRAVSKAAIRKKAVETTITPDDLSLETK